MFKTILVHLRGNKGDEATLASALKFGNPFGAHLECVHVQPSVGDLISDLMKSDIDLNRDQITELVASLQAESARTAKRALDGFATFCTQQKLPQIEIPPGPGASSAAYREIMGRELATLSEQARYHDLLVLRAGSVADGGLSMSEKGRLITHTGRPVLLTPERQKSGEIRTVVIAWKDTPEAARAISTAMPVIARSNRVLVITAEERAEEMSHLENVVKQLNWHGLSAEGHKVSLGDRSGSHAVLAAASAADADLLVMGGYGRSRLTEFILGGFTQTVLQEGSLPVLMVH